MDIDILPRYFTAKLIPAFFVTKWQEMQKTAKEYETTNDYEPVSDFIRESRTPIFAGIIFSALGAFIAAMVSVLIIAHHQPQPTIITISGIIAITLGVTTIWLLHLTPTDERNGHMFFKEVKRLYDRFNIDVSKNVGAMSFEEFRANIEDELRDKALLVDSLKGFGRNRFRTEFNEMHAAALVWGLCHESHAHYYHAKVKS